MREVAEQREVEHDNVFAVSITSSLYADFCKLIGIGESVSGSQSAGAIWSATSAARRYHSNLVVISSVIEKMSSTLDKNRAFSSVGGNS